MIFVILAQLVAMKRSRSRQNWHFAWVPLCFDQTTSFVSPWLFPRRRRRMACPRSLSQAQSNKKGGFMVIYGKHGKFMGETSREFPVERVETWCWVQAWTWTKDNQSTYLQTWWFIVKSGHIWIQGWELDLFRSFCWKWLKHLWSYICFVLLGHTPLIKRKK